MLYIHDHTAVNVAASAPKPVQSVHTSSAPHCASSWPSIPLSRSLTLSPPTCRSELTNEHESTVVRRPSDVDPIVGLPVDHPGHARAETSNLPEEPSTVTTAGENVKILGEGSNSHATAEEGRDGVARVKHKKWLEATDKTHQVVAILSQG